MMPVLVGDLGGTHTRLAIAETRDGEFHLTAKATYLNSEAADLAGQIGRFLSTNPKPRAACLAIAGPVHGPRARLTNLDWVIDADELRREFGFESFTLVNDFEAVARGIDGIPPGQRVALQDAPVLVEAPRLALGPGTGLGVALSLWSGGCYRPFPSEGGHVSFAPVDEEQEDLLDFLRGRYGRVSVERILSGPGIVDLYAFFKSFAGSPGPQRPPAEISAAALAGDDPAAGAAMRLFARILGQTAGDLALVTLARGGVFVAGGIPAKILPFLGTRDFIDGFTAKGRFGDWLRQIPVWVVTDPDIGLRGAAAAARDAAG